MLNGVKGLTPASGTFEITVTIGGQTVVVRGAVVNGVTKARNGLHTMSDAKILPRRLSLSEHAVLLWILRALPNRGEAELLYVQSTAAVIEGGPLTMLSLSIPPSHAPTSIPDGPLPIHAVAYDDEGALLGELLVWVSGGYLSAIEFAWYTDSAPIELPAPSQLRLE